MAFTLWNLLLAGLLCINAVCVLHEERFLSKFGWGHSQVRGFEDTGTGAKAQILNLIRSIRTVMRIPLIAINVVVIVVKLILG